MALKSPNPFVELRPGEDPTPERLREILRMVQENFDHYNDQFPVVGSNIGSGMARAVFGGAKFASAASAVHFAGSTLSENLVVTHHLPATPSVVVATSLGAPGPSQVPVMNVFSMTATTFTINGEIKVAFTGNIGFSWIAIA